MTPLLSVEDLKVYFYSEDGEARAVDGVSYQVEAGQTLGLVGESGCGKSVSALAILKLIPSPPGKIVGGKVFFEGKNLLNYSERAIQQMRGNQISMIFQEPMTALNPLMTIGDQIGEVIIRHQHKDKIEARRMVIRLLEEVGIPAPDRRLDDYPHQLSGGMKQRAMIAIALACKPKILIADEPSTALDVTVQAQILDLLRKLQNEYGMAIILITHDLGVIAEMADTVSVMYAGKIAETTSTSQLFKEPLHPYTNGLFRAIPSIQTHHDKLEIIPGVVPNPLEFPIGCRFADRCGYVFSRCHDEDPLLIQSKGGHQVACHWVNK